MKDSNHHRKHTQKKVVQSARKEQVQEVLASANASVNGSFSKKMKKPSYWAF